MADGASPTLPTTVVLHHGDNGIHEYYEDIGGQVCILMNHGDPHWVVLFDHASRVHDRWYANAEAAMRGLVHEGLASHFHVDLTVEWRDRPEGDGIDLYPTAVPVL